MKIQEATIAYIMDDGSYGEFTGNAAQIKEFIDKFQENSSRAEAYRLMDISDPIEEALEIGDVLQSKWDGSGGFDQISKGDRLSLVSWAKMGTGAHLMHKDTGEQFYFMPSEICEQLQKVED